MNGDFTDKNNEKSNTNLNLFLLRDKLFMKRNSRILEKVQLPKIPIKQNNKYSETNQTDSLNIENVKL